MEASLKKKPSQSLALQMMRMISQIDSSVETGLTTLRLNGLGASYIATLLRDPMSIGALVSQLFIAPAYKKMYTLIYNLPFLAGRRGKKKIKALPTVTSILVGGLFARNCFTFFSLFFNFYNFFEHFFD